MFLCVCGHGGWRARLATVSPARWTSLSYRPMHARPAWRWPVCAWSVHGHVASAVVVLLVCGRVSRLLVGLLGVRSLSRSRICCAQAFHLLRCWSVPGVWGRHGTFSLCSARPPRGREAMTSGRTAVKIFSPAGALFPAPPSQCGMHNPLSGISRCSVAVLPVSLVPLLCTPPVGGKAPPVPLGVSLCSPWEPQGVVPARWCGARARARLTAVRFLVSCSAGHSGGVPVSRCWVRWPGWLGWFGLCCGVGTLRPTWWVGLGVTHPCLLAGGRRGPMW